MIVIYGAAIKANHQSLRHAFFFRKSCHKFDLPDIHSGSADKSSALCLPCEVTPRRDEAGSSETWDLI
jgi:hypothetical protein